MNKVILVGRLTDEPKATTTENNNLVVRFSLAVDRRFKQDGGQTADFPNCVAFGKTAEFVYKYFHKAMKMGLEGRLQTGSFTDKDGVKRYTTDVIAENVEFCESKKAEETPPPSNDEWVQVPKDIEDSLPFK